MVYLTSSLLLLTVSTLASATQWGQYHNTNNNRETSVAGNIDKRVADSEHQDDKVQAIVNRGNKMQKIIKNLLRRNYHKKREILQGNVRNIISNNLRTESGLNVVIKQIIRNKLKNLQEKANEEKSAVQILLDQSIREPNFLDQTVGRSETFLDKLINVMKKEGENKKTVTQQARKPKLLNFDSEEEDGEEERPLRFFEEVGLVENSDQNTLKNEIEEEREKEERPLRFFEEVGLVENSNQNTLKNEIEEDREKEEDALNFFAEAGLIRGHSENTADGNENIDHEHSATNSFLEEEINAAESETAFLADEIAEILVQLDADLGAEDQMMTKSDDMIQDKLKRFPMEMLLRVNLCFIDTYSFSKFIKRTEILLTVCLQDLLS